MKVFDTNIRSMPGFIHLGDVTNVFKRNVENTVKTHYEWVEESGAEDVLEGDFAPVSVAYAYATYLSPSFGKTLRGATMYDRTALIESIRSMSDEDLTELLEDNEILQVPGIMPAGQSGTLTFAVSTETTSEQVVVEMLKHLKGNKAIYVLHRPKASGLFGDGKRKSHGSYKYFGLDSHGQTRYSNDLLDYNLELVSERVAMMRISNFLEPKAKPETKKKVKPEAKPKAEPEDVPEPPTEEYKKPKGKGKGRK